tara:strand:+ start:303 stop:605 length:303 start_codon:yes stop_codon:yes gene_type:complete
MLYKVQARFIKDKGKEFYQKLTDGTIEKQRPDGSEIVASMNRAKIDPTGLVKWTETCYCPSPLYHERSTIYDNYFTDMKTEVVENHEDFEGDSFMKSISS